MIEPEIIQSQLKEKAMKNSLNSIFANGKPYTLDEAAKYFDGKKIEDLSKLTGIAIYAVAGKETVSTCAISVCSLKGNSISSAYVVIDPKQYNRIKKDPANLKKLLNKIIDLKNSITNSANDKSTNLVVIDLGLTLYIEWPSRVCSCDEPSVNNYENWS